MESVWKVEGMHCADCAAKVQAALEAVPGVLSARVHYLHREATIVHEQPVEEAEVMRAVDAAGYRVAPHEGSLERF